MKQKNQISYEENFEVVVKLSNYVLPLSLIAIFLVGIAFHTDILLALVVVSLIYVYILVSQYKITKRYYKSRGVIYVRNQKFREELWQEASLVRD